MLEDLTVNESFRDSVHYKIQTSNNMEKAVEKAVNECTQVSTYSPSEQILHLA